MPVNPGLTTTIPSGQTYYRITSLGFKTPNPVDYVRVVDGQGAVNSQHGARYNHPGAETVYLAEDLETCFAEKMFYFHREVIRGIDWSTQIGVVPPFQHSFILWEIELAQSILNVFDMTISGAPNFFHIFPSLPLNPSQDYYHLKEKRAEIQHNGYRGIIVESSRKIGTGKMVVLFHDQSNNIASITPYDVEYRLVTSTGAPFINHTTEILDFTGGEVRITTNPLPAGAVTYGNWQRIDFNH
jgi:hypothetical protein